MLNPSIRDVQYRKMRFVLAILGVSLLFMLILIMDGIGAGMKSWMTKYVSDTGADAWAIQTDTDGPFSSYSVLPAGVQKKIEELEGVNKADALVMAMQNTKIAGQNKRIYVIGYEKDSLVKPKKLKKGRYFSKSREAVVDESLKVKIGSTVKVAGQRFEVAGVSKDTAFSFNSPIVFVSLKDAQEILFNKQPAINTVAITKAADADLSDVTEEVDDIKGVDVKSQNKMLDVVLRQIEQPLGMINFFRMIFWLVGALIVAMIVYVTAVERTRDFAVFKAIGAKNRYITSQVLIQALLISLTAVSIGIGLAFLLKPAFPMKLSIETISLISTPVIAVMVSMLSSLVAIRKATKVDPVIAFGGK